MTRAATRWIEDPLYHAALLDMIRRARPKWPVARIAKELGISRDRLRRIRNYTYVVKLPLQLKMESLLDPDDVRQTQQRFQSPVPSYWDKFF